MTQNSKHYAVVTELGKQLLRDAYEQHRSINLTQMSLGDSNGAYVTPDVRFDSLVNELGQEALHEGTVHEHFIHAIVYVNRSRFAGKHIREFGLRDEDGNLIVYAAYPETLVSDEATSQFIQLEIECMVELENTEMVSLTITPIYPHATENEAGIARIATNEQVNEGENDSSFLTIKKLVHSLSVPHIIDKLVSNLWLKLAAKIFPVGGAIPWFSDVAPEGFAIMKNQAYDTVVYTELAKVWPNGIIPDMRGCGVIGKEDGETIGVYEEGQVKRHGHDGSSASSTNLGSKTTSSDTHSHRYNYSAYGEYVGNGTHKPVGRNAGTTNTTSHAHSHSVAIGSHAHTLMIALFGGTKNTINHRKVNWIVRMA